MRSLIVGALILSLFVAFAYASESYWMLQAAKRTADATEGTGGTLTKIQQDLSNVPEIKTELKLIRQALEKIAAALDKQTTKG